VEGTSQAVLGSCGQRKVPASLSLFLKSAKIPALLYVGQGPAAYRALLLYLVATTCLTFVGTWTQDDG